MNKYDPIYIGYIYISEISFFELLCRPAPLALGPLAKRQYAFAGTSSGLNYSRCDDVKRKKTNDENVGPKLHLPTEQPHQENKKLPPLDQKVNLNYYSVVLNESHSIVNIPEIVVCGYKYFEK